MEACRFAKTAKIYTLENLYPRNFPAIQYIHGARMGINNPPIKFDDEMDTNIIKCGYYFLSLAVSLVTVWSVASIRINTVYYNATEGKY